MFSKKYLLILIFIFVMGCRTEILHCISEEQANDIISVLQENGVVAEKKADNKGEKSNFNILIDESDYARAWKVLKENGLPREKVKGLSDIYQKQGIISSSTEEKALLIQAIKGEIEKTLETIDNVIRARVIITIPAGSQNPFSEIPASVGASVLLKVKKGTYINKEMIKGIIQGAVSSLERDRVNVEIVESQIAGGSNNISMTYIGPFLVSTTSAKYFYALMVFLLSLTMVSTGFLAYGFYRKRIMQTEDNEEVS